MCTDLYIPVVELLLVFCFELCRESFIHGNICFVMTGVTVLEALFVGDFFFCEVLREFGDAGKGGACCCLSLLAAWLLTWLLLVRMQLPFMELILCVGGRIVGICTGQTGPSKSLSMLAEGYD